MHNACILHAKCMQNACTDACIMHALCMHFAQQSAIIPEGQALSLKIISIIWHTAL